MSPPSEPERSSRRDQPLPAPCSDNPFIAFRRYADSQVSSLLQSVIGLPSLFSQPNSDHSWRSIEDGRLTRNDASHEDGDDDNHRLPFDHEAGGFIGAIQRELRDIVREAEDELQKARQEREMRRWGEYRTEEKSSQDKVTTGGSGRQQSPSTDRNFVTASNEVYQKVVDERGEGHGFWADREEPDQSAILDPFDLPESTIRWLYHDDYSPLHLDRSLPYKYGKEWYHVDAHDPYFRADTQVGELYPLFSHKQKVHHDPRLANRVDWRAAFRDLLDIHHKGYSASQPPHEDYILPRETGAGAWIAHLVGSGSLGTHWSTIQTPQSPSEPFLFRYGWQPTPWAVLPASGSLFVQQQSGLHVLPKASYDANRDGQQQLSKWKFPVSQAPDACEEITQQPDLDRAPEADEPTSYRPVLQKAAIKLIQDPQTTQSSLRAIDRVLRIIENTELEEEVEDLLSTILGDCPDRDHAGISPETMIDSLDERLRLGWTTLWDDALTAVESEHPDVYGVEFREGKGVTKEETSRNRSPDSAHQSFRSSSSTSNDAATSSPVLSTATTIETRTRSDGTRETKRVFRRRFADGSEEREESTETHDESGASPPALQDKSIKEEDRDLKSAGLVSRRARKGLDEVSQRPGWFWK